MKNLFPLLLIFLMLSCEQKSNKEKVDSLIINANVYTVSANFAKAEAFAIKDGKFVEIGSSKDLKNKYSADTIIDAQGKTILPGLIDAHCHFLRQGIAMQSVELSGTKSMDEVLDRVVEFQKKNQMQVIYGRGWDQNDWEVKEFPTKDKLDSLFPDTPVMLERIDGHASIYNDAAIKKAGVTEKDKIEGGDVILKNGKITGVFVDMAQDLVNSKFPAESAENMKKALILAQDMCIGYGLTTVDDAGLDRNEIELIDQMQKNNELNIRLYAMVSADSSNLKYYLETGPYKTDYLNVRSFKVYGDGALGSRGALLREPYSDSPGKYGLPVTSNKEINEIAEKVANSKFQMNTHAIGDSANHSIIQTYKRVLHGQSDRRWRIEHAQIVSPEDFKEFDNIIPSVQPTHATSDMYWAEDRLGAERIKTAYVMKELLKANGRITLGTDFPVEQVNPFLTFYAAVARQDLDKFPEDGYQIENGLSREETLKGMTIWAAYSNFEEHEKGSIEVGKFADFILLDRDIMEVDIYEVPKTNVIQTYIGGKPMLK
ncbi:hypothetical protein SAMN03097699_1603 [Flavobacteriaceae bacterium MAR_2010_188]|nr:hypothetical protein SAMN03097699_1603 [Flavobacteriaceae bacterium MAR_2010_188]